MIKGGPKIINDGLVLCLDAHDAKSYAGEPVTNLYGDISTTSVLRPNRTEYNTSGTWTTDMPMCPENVGRVYKHTSGALTSSWSGNSYGYMLKDIATTSGETYIVTCWVYVSSDCNISGCPVVIEQEASGESTISGYDGGYDLNNKGTWQLLAKKCVADDLVRFIPLYPSRNGVTDGSFSGFFAWGGAQVVKASYVTPFVLSSRSPTNGWVDRSGNSNSGTLVNGVNTGVSHYRDGQVIMPVANSYLDFDGSNDYVDCGNVAAFSNAESFSVEVWFKYEGSGGGYFPIISKEGSSQFGYGLKIDGSVTGAPLVYAIATGSTNRYQYASPTLSSSNWYHVCASFDASAGYITLYLNGSQNHSGSYYNQGSFSGAQTSNSLTVGTNYGGAYFTGKVAGAKIYNKVLTAAEVLSNYNATKNRFT
ncbi:MAG: hypothetical protein RLZZ337_593 [Bacteroidota bacterium]|jgi:hypothetical protein